MAEGEVFPQTGAKEKLSWNIDLIHKSTQAPCRVQILPLPSISDGEVSFTEPDVLW